MRRRSRFRRFGKWAGVCAMAFVLLLWTGSLFWWGRYWWRAKTWDCQIECNWGTLSLDVFRRGGRLEWPWGVEPGLYLVSHTRWREIFAQQGWLDPLTDRNHYGFVLPKLLTFPSPKLQAEFGTVFWVRLPLWFPLLILVVSTSLLLWRDRHFPPGHCQNCGYNLTGNVTGRCPECATPVPSPEMPAPDRR